MNRIVILAVVGTVAIAAILVAQLALIPVAVLGLAAWFAWGRTPAARSRLRVASMVDVVDRGAGWRSPSRSRSQQSTAAS